MSFGRVCVLYAPTASECLLLMLDALHELQLQPGRALLQENQRRSISIYLYFNLGLQTRQIWLGQAARRLKVRVNADLMYDGLLDDETEDNKL